MHLLRNRKSFQRARCKSEGVKWNKMYRRPSVNIYVRNKARYNPSTEGKDFVCVNITDFAGTTIGDIKEEVKRRCRNTLKIDDLFLDNRPLDDDRSVAHFNLEDGTILETTSNPFWVTCINIKHIEVEREQKAQPNDKHTQNWTRKSIIRKRTLLSVLLNSKNEFPSQPPHFPTLEDFNAYLEVIEKKGATMNPNYTGRDLRLLQHDYRNNDEGKSDDPLGSFIHRHSVRLGFRRPDPVLYNNRVGLEDLPGGGRGRGRGRRRDNNNNTGPAPRIPGWTSPTQPGQTSTTKPGQKKSMKIMRRVCEDCEAAEAEVYCGECQNASGGLGLVLCRGCTTALHMGAVRRRHVVTDIDQAPKQINRTLHTPFQAFKAPFSLLVALYSGFTSRPPVLSMTEDEVKDRAQPLTDTDLHDKQNGRYVGGFECMENTLMQKGFVQREDARNPTYALTHKGQNLAEQLFSFQQIVSRYLASQGVPKIDIPLRLRTTCGRRKICLIIDEQERDRERLLHLAAERNIDAQVRQLPSGDYIWILTPPLNDTRQKYSQKNTDEELVLPYIVERKTWEDLQESIRTKRFDKQVNNMMESGLKNLFYLMEGSVGCMKYKMTEEQRTKLKGAVEKLMLQNGFYVNYTASWFKSALWLVWMTSLLTLNFSQGKLDDHCLPYLEYRRRTSRHAVGTVVMATDTRKGQHVVWSADRFTELIFRESADKGEVIQELKHDIHQSSPEKVKSVLVVQNLEIYNKRRQTTLNKCLEEVFGDLQHMADGVENKLQSCLHNMLHYDIMSYWQLRLQVMANVYVVRTENENETQRIQQEVEESGNPARQGRMSDFHTFGTGELGRNAGRMGSEGHDGIRGEELTHEKDGQRTRRKGKGIGQRGKGKAQNIPVEPDRLTDENEIADTDQTVFASDSQTEDFMIQQAIARSIQDRSMNEGSDESDGDSTSHYSTRVTPHHRGENRGRRRGQGSNTDDLGQTKTTFPGSGKQLGYNDARNDGILGQRSTDSTNQKARDALDIDILDEEEQLRLAIKKSLEEAEQQKEENKLPYPCQTSQVKCLNSSSINRKDSGHSDGENSSLHHHLSEDKEATKQQRLIRIGKVQYSTRSQDKMENGEDESSRTEDTANHPVDSMTGDSQDEELQRIILLSKQEYEGTLVTPLTAGPPDSRDYPVIMIDSQELEFSDQPEKDRSPSEDQNRTDLGPVCSGSVQSPIILIDSQDSPDSQVDEDDLNQSNCVKCRKMYKDFRCHKTSNKVKERRVGDEVDGCRSETGGTTGCDVVCDTVDTPHQNVKALSANVDSLTESLVPLNGTTVSETSGSGDKTSSSDSGNVTENDRKLDETNMSPTEITNAESVSELRNNILVSQSPTPTNKTEALGGISQTSVKERQPSLDESPTLAEDISTVNDMCQSKMDSSKESCDDSNMYKKAEILPKQASVDVCGRAHSLFTRDIDTLDENQTEISNNILAQDTQEDEDNLETLTEDDDIEVIPPSPEKNCEKVRSFYKTGNLHVSPGSRCKVTRESPGVGHFTKEQSYSVSKISSSNSSAEGSPSNLLSSNVLAKCPSQTDCEDGVVSSHQQLVSLETVMFNTLKFSHYEDSKAEELKSSHYEDSKAEELKSSHYEDSKAEESQSILCGLETKSHLSLNSHTNWQDEDGRTDEEDSQDLCNIGVLPPLSPSPSTDHITSPSSEKTPHLGNKSPSTSQKSTTFSYGNSALHSTKISPSLSSKSLSPPPKSPSPVRGNSSLVLDNGVLLRSPSPPLSPSSLPNLSPPLSPSSLPNLSPLHGESLSPPQGSFPNQDTPLRVASEISSCSPRNPYVDTSPKQSSNNKVVHSPAKRLCTSSIFNTESNYSSSVGRSDDVGVDNLSSELHTNTNQVRGLGPTDGGKEIIIKQEKLDECEKYSDQGFKESVTTGPSYRFKNQVSEQCFKGGVDDEEVARKLQELFDKEYEMTLSQRKKLEKQQACRSGSAKWQACHSDKPQVSRERKSSVKNVEGIDTTNDVVIAQQLQQELLMGDNSAVRSTLQVNRYLEERDRLYAEQLQQMESGKGQPRKQNSTTLTGADHSEVHDSLLARQLQEEEEKKIRQGQTTLKDDEALARQLAETEERPIPVIPRTVQKRHADSSPDLSSPKHVRRDVGQGASPARASSSVGGPTSAGTSVERVWHRKLFAMEKQARKSSSEQLCSIRREQNQRYQALQSGGQAANISRNITHTASSPWQHPHTNTSSSGEEESQYVGLDDDGYITSSPPRRQPGHVFLPRGHTPSHFKSNNTDFGSVSSNPSSKSSASRNLADRSSGFQDHKSSFPSTQSSSSSAWDDIIPRQVNWNDSQDFKSSQASSSISSTQSSLFCNVTCGNCGEKGHNRNSKTCSRYYSLEETQHRQAKQEKARQRTEEKAEQERQTREQLANHQLVLEDIAFRIQQEKDGLSNTIKKMDKKTKQKDKRKK
ncbi:uncharacterized protein LOC117344746 [Pecten maximus]|uniref:uncharacterized protein LOC117344746 n=1 Tax=Pecten maximus TaxID=6579 RepID=UPI0014581BD9|nr:uncharacterized protein LOC117344746 [Pecten maximus]